MEGLVKWSNSVGISINVNKTKAMILGSNHNLRRLQEIDLPPIIIGNSTVPFSESCKNLGVFISSDLTWNDQISSIISKVNYSLSLFYKKSQALPIDVKKLLANQLLLPHFEYSCIVYNSLTAYLETKLLKLQNSCIRFIYNLKKGEHITAYRKNLGWLMPKFRRHYCLGILVYKILLYKRPSYLYRSLYDYKALPPTINLRPTTQKYFDIPLSRTSNMDSTFLINALNFWNKLPEKVRTADSLNIFKNRLYQYLLNTQNE